MVSVIIPVYNVKDYLDECVASVLKLKTETEILLVDDGSTDGSGLLCDAWAEKHSHVRVIHQENGGLSAARNRGIQNARGSHLLFLDSDDFLDPEETDRMLGHLTDSTDVLMGLYNNYYTSENRYAPESAAGFLSLSGTVPVARFLEAIPADGSSCYMTAWRFVCRRAWALANELLFFADIYHEDEEWTARLLCKAQEITVTDCYFYQYRQARSGAITSGVKPKHLFDSLTIIRHHQTLEKEHPDNLQYLQRRQGMLYLNCLINLHTVQGAEKKQICSQLRQLRRCASHMSGKIGKLARLCLKLTGVRITGMLLGAAKKIRG